MESLAFIAALNESPITFVTGLSLDWDGVEGDGYEAYSIYGEVRAFATWADANAWRLGVILDGEVAAGSSNLMYGQD